MWVIRKRYVLVLVVIAKLGDIQIIINDFVNDTMFIVNAPRPISG